MRENNKKSGLMLALGHIIECFDNTLYGFFSVILGPVFFPSSSHSATILAAYGAFAAGFLARPFGAIFFGHIGDRYGRKKPLLLSMMLVGIPTMIIGLLPSYDTIGLLAPFTLIFCRLSQGFFMGGEFAGVNLYISETSPRNALGKQTGRIIASGITGAILATLVGSLVVLPVMPKWMWRIPFVIGGISAFVIYFYRKKLTETHDFIQLEMKKEKLSSPVLEIFRKHKACIIMSALLSGLTIVPLYCSTILGIRIFKSLGYSDSASLILNTFGMIVDAVFVLYSGILADRIGFRKTLIYGTIAIIIAAFPSFWFLTGASVSTLDLVFYILVLTGTGCIINGCAMPYIACSFPVGCRYSGMAISITAGQALFAGTTPVIGSFLIDRLSSNGAPIFWVLLMSFLTLGALMIVRKPAEHQI